MAVCQLCKRDFKKLKFVTGDIKVCTHCVNSINRFKEPAVYAQGRLGEKLARGMERNALRDLESAEDWKRRSAIGTLENFESAYQKALPSWLNRLLADERNTSRDYKTLRAHRRGLLRFDGHGRWSYPSNWKEVAVGIRGRDGYQCVACGAREMTLDVHHIIYLSNYGTNQKSNLVTLCRPCHENEHGHLFDFGEPDDPESPVPIQPSYEQRLDAEKTEFVERVDEATTSTQPEMSRVDSRFASSETASTESISEGAHMLMHVNPEHVSQQPQEDAESHLTQRVQTRKSWKVQHVPKAPQADRLEGWVLVAIAVSVSLLLMSLKG